MCIWRVRARVLLSVEQLISKHTDNCCVVILTPIKKTSTKHVFFTAWFDSLGVSVLRVRKKNRCYHRHETKQFFRWTTIDWWICIHSYVKRKKMRHWYDKSLSCFIARMLSSRFLLRTKENTTRAWEIFFLSFSCLGNVPKMIDNEIFKRFALYAGDYTFWSIKCAEYNRINKNGETKKKKHMVVYLYCLCTDFHSEWIHKK